MRGDPSARGWLLVLEVVLDCCKSFVGCSRTTSNLQPETWDSKVFDGSGYEQSPLSTVRRGLGSVTGLDRHYDVKEDQTTLSPECQKPCQAGATPRLRRLGGWKFGLIGKRSDLGVNGLPKGFPTTVRESNDRVAPKNQVMTPDEQLMTVQELALYLGVPVATLYQWRYRREGPPGFRVGRHVRYRRTDIQAWIEDQLRIRNSRLSG